MSKKISIEGGIPLQGNVRLSGSLNSSFRLIAASMLSSEDIVLDNVPRVPDLEVDLEIIQKLGGNFKWLSSNKLLLNGSSINSFEIPYAAGSKNRTAVFLSAALIYRFGKAIIPKPEGCRIGPRPINRLIETWKAFGVEVLEDSSHYVLRADSLRPATISFPKPTHSGTDNAILFASFMPGESVINNAVEESETDDLISFLVQLGVNIQRIDARTVKVMGANVFKGGAFSVQPDKNEACIFAAAAFATGGNVSIRPISRAPIISFVNTLSKAGCLYEFNKDELRVWASGGEITPLTVTTTFAPGFVPAWQPLITLVLTKASGESLVHDTVYTDRWDFTKDLNRMGAKIQLFKPSELNMEMIINDDSYDVAEQGEPQSVARISGPSILKGSKLAIQDLKAGPVLVLAALVASGKSEVSGLEHIERGYDNLLGKLVSLGANIQEI